MYFRMSLMCTCIAVLAIGCIPDADDMTRDEPTADDISAQEAPATVEDVDPTVVLDRRCNDRNLSDGRIRGCVQRDNLNEFNAGADVVTSSFHDVLIFLEQCDGNGRSCGNVTKPVEVLVTGHQIVPTPIFPGQHGHAYRARYFVDRLGPYFSPFIPFP